MRTRLSSRKGSRTRTGPSAARAKKATAGRVPSRPDRLGAALAEEPGGADYEDPDEEQQVEHFLPRRADHVRADDLDGGDDQAGDERAGHVAEPAQHDRHVGDEHELEPDRRGG